MRLFRWRFGAAMFVMGLVLPGRVTGATLTPVQGTLQLLKADASDWVTVSAEREVQEGDQIQTGPRARAFLVAPGDHRIAIGPESHVTLELFAQGQTKLVLKSGSLRSKVQKLRDLNRESFKVQTPTVVVAVRGTDFSILQAEAVRVQVFEGAVDLERLEKEVSQAVVSLQAGQRAEVNSNGVVQPPSPAQAPEARSSGAPPQKPGAWWEGPQNMQKEPDLFGSFDDEKPRESPRPDPKHGPRPPQDPLSPASNLLPPIPPGNGGTTGTGSATGLEALIDTMRSKNLHDQANAILVADLYQQNAVRTDPLTGQLRQYADAIQKIGTDGIRYINATMMPNVPDSLNTTVADTRFNAALPADYWTATKSAFAADSTPPAWYAVEYHTAISNTVDVLQVDATGGSSVLNVSDGLYETEFANVSTRINGTTLWSKTGSTYFYRGGSAPVTTQNATGRADIEVRDQYADGTYLSVRHTFANDLGQIASSGSRPSAMTAVDYLNSLHVRTTLRSNLFTRGSLDIFGQARARSLSGHFSFDEFDASDILSGLDQPYGALLGLVNN